jgi:hypothetical protein
MKTGTAPCRAGNSARSRLFSRLGRGWFSTAGGSTDLAILRAFAAKLQHVARNELESPFVHYVENQPPRARDHFYGLSEAKPDQPETLLAWTSAFTNFFPAGAPQSRRRLVAECEGQRRIPGPIV